MIVNKGETRRETEVVRHAATFGYKVKTESDVASQSCWGVRIPSHGYSRGRNRWLFVVLVSPTVLFTGIHFGISILKR